MTPDQVNELKEGDALRCTSPAKRCQVDLVTDNFVRVLWPGRNAYDVLRKSSPLWYNFEKV